MMVRLVSYGVRECRQGAIDRERETKRTSQTRKGRKGEHRTEYVHFARLVLAKSALGRSPLLNFYTVRLLFVY